MENEKAKTFTSAFLTLLDKLFTPETTILSRMISLVVIFCMGMIWYKGEHLVEMYKAIRFEDYQEAVIATKNAAFDIAITEQVQIAYTASGSDWAAIYQYTPKNINNFYDIVAYEGALPVGVNTKNITKVPIDKTSHEYKTQLSGFYFSSTTIFDFLPLEKGVQTDMHFVFSCPIFNMDNIYSGMVSLMWREKPDMAIERLNSICGQATRTLGRLK